MDRYVTYINIIAVCRQDPPCNGRMDTFKVRLQLRCHQKNKLKCFVFLLLFVIACLNNFGCNFLLYYFHRKTVSIYYRYTHRYIDLSVDPIDYV